MFRRTVPLAVVAAIGTAAFLGAGTASAQAPLEPNPVNCQSEEAMASAIEAADPAPTDAETEDFVTNCGLLNKARVTPEDLTADECTTLAPILDDVEAAADPEVDAVLLGQIDDAQAACAAVIEGRDGEGTGTSTPTTTSEEPAPDPGTDPGTDPAPDPGLVDPLADPLADGESQITEIPEGSVDTGASGSTDGSDTDEVLTGVLLLVAATGAGTVAVRRARHQR